MTLTIWVDDWQIQCCGESFAPGDVVSWTLLEADPEDYADVIGSERAAEIDFCEEHHGQDEGHAPTSVEVVSIVEVHCRYGVPPGAMDKVNYPVPGTTVLVPVEKADGWAKARPHVRFAGYLVTARRVTDLPKVQLIAVDEGPGGHVPDACQIERLTTVIRGSLRRPQLVTAVAARRGAELP